MAGSRLYSDVPSAPKTAPGPIAWPPAITGAAASGERRSSVPPATSHRAGVAQCAVEDERARAGLRETAAGKRRVDRRRAGEDGNRAAPGGKRERAAGDRGIALDGDRTDVDRAGI